VKYRFEDFVNTESVELPEDAPRLDKLEQEVSQLRVQFADLKVDFESLKTSIAHTEEWIEGWFRTHISALADQAAKEFVQKREIECALTALEKVEMRKQIEQSVEAVFQREANELAKAVLSRIQPYALKQR
jgi:hypothetical protein